MAQSVMTRVIDGTFAGYGLKLAPDSEMPANRRLPGEIDLAKRVSRVGKSDTPRFYDVLETCRGSEKAADDLHVTAQIPFEEAKDLDLLISTFREFQGTW
jgi:hypothetical protein